MTPKEKAEDIFIRILRINYNGNCIQPKYRALELSLLCIDEIRKTKMLCGVDYDPFGKEYWCKVYQEIENIDT